MAEKKKIKASCSSCDRETNHDVLCEASEGVDEYSLDIYYQIVECRGCESKTFRRVTYNYLDAYQISEEEWEVPSDVDYYPPILMGHQPMEMIHIVPEKVAAIYLQTLEAIKSGYNVLAGIGLRATIEAICNDRQIAGRNLVTMIDKLTKSGFISQTDADRLHAIRFLGNDAAHEVEAPEKGALLVSLGIVEHCLESVYTLDAAAQGVLHTVLRTYQEFEAVLIAKINGVPTGTELPLLKYLEDEYRRCYGYISAHEATLRANITSGTFTQLTIGKLDNFAGSKEKFQHYIIP